MATSLEDRPSSATFLSTPRSATVSSELARGSYMDDEPNRAKARAGVPWASRMSMGRSGLCCFIVGYVERTNCLWAVVRKLTGICGCGGPYLTPWDASPVCEKRILTSRRDGESTLASDMAMRVVRKVRPKMPRVRPSAVRARDGKYVLCRGSLLSISTIVECGLQHESDCLSLNALMY